MILAIPIIMQIAKASALNVLITVKYAQGHKIIAANVYKAITYFQSQLILMNAQNA